MNYYNPYFAMYPSYAASAPATGGILGKIIGVGKGMNWGSFLSGTQKVLGVANQAIPLVRQVSPVVRNAKTMFQVMNEFKKVDTPTSEAVSSKATTSNYVVTEETTTSFNQSEGPTFFI